MLGICRSVYMYIVISIFMHADIHEYVGMYISMYVCRYKSIDLNMCECVICIYAFTYIWRHESICKYV